MLFAQTEVTIDNYSVNLYGQVGFRFKAALTNITSSKRSTVADFEWPASMTMGSDGTMVISVPGAAYDSNRSVWEYDLANLATSMGMES